MGTVEGGMCPKESSCLERSCALVKRVKESSCLRDKTRKRLGYCGGSGRKHTPIVSEKQRRFFGAELARKRAGKQGKTGMGKATLERHLEERGS